MGSLESIYSKWQNKLVAQNHPIKVLNYTSFWF